MTLMRRNEVPHVSGKEKMLPTAVAAEGHLLSWNRVVSCRPCLVVLLKYEAKNVACWFHRCATNACIA
jgi:hypothetical protein